jgi:hypothetical protein
MKRKLKLKGRGGPGRGQGRKPGSTRPEKRILLAKAYALVIAEIMREGNGRNAAARQAFLKAYREDHPKPLKLSSWPLVRL